MLRPALLTVLSATALAAQTPGGTPAQAPRAQVVAKAVVARSAPRSFQIVRISVPIHLRDADSVTYTVTAADGFSIVGRTTGTVQATGGPDVLVTVAVPAGALAGTHSAARVVFLSRASEVTVPIELTVTATRGLSLTAPAEIAGLRDGERFEIPLQIQNRGNAADTIRMVVGLPAGWRASALDTANIVVPAFATVTRVVKLSVPNKSGTGNFFVRFLANSSSADAHALVPLTVGSMLDETAPPGALVRASLGSVAVQGESMQAVPQIAVSGPLANGISIDGRLTLTPEVSAPLVRGLANVGTFISAPHLIAWTPRWRGTLGSTVLGMTDLTGINAGGRGLAFDMADTARVLSLVAARSDAGSAESGSNGELFGAHFEQNLSFLRVGATATHLRAPGSREQELSAFGLQARSYPIRNLTLGGETAYRKYADGSGVGWTARLHHEHEDDRAELRITHAPGGSQAFARAEKEAHFSFVRALTSRLDLAGTLIAADDKALARQAFRSRSAGLVPSYLLSEKFRVRADLRHTSFDVDAAPIGYGNSETHFGLGGGGSWKDYSYSTDLGLARLSRSVTAVDIDAVDHGLRLGWRVNGLRATPFGIFELESSYERNSDGTGYLPSQFVVTARGHRIQIPALSSRLELDGELAVQSWSGIKTTPVLRVGAQYFLAETTVALGVEHNPLLTGLQQKTPWIVALKVERSLGLPRIVMGRASGVVYRDFNGNGQRDAGEPGVPDVVVRRGGARATSASDGSYRFFEEGTGRVTVDPTTILQGWIVGNSRDGNVALVATTRLEVTLEPGAAERARNVDLSAVTVIARDASGREWTGRRVASEVALFEALPVGSYTIDADFSAMAEPLRVNGSIRIDVTEGVLARVQLPVAGRPLRFRQNRQ
jgi:hypothetical protein